MKQQFMWMLGVVAVLVAVVALIFAANARPPAAVGLAAAGRVAAGESDSAVPKGGLAAPLAACTKMKASAVAWVTLTDEGDLGDQVDSYPSGTTTITPVFEYNCVPKKTTIVTVFSLDDEVVFSDKESLKASNGKNRYAYPLGTTDESPMDEGTWKVEFFNNKTLLTSGEVELGAGDNNGTDPGNTARVEGTVTDKKTRKPIEGATILVLVDTTVQDWLDNDKPQENVATAGRSDSTGAFTMQNPLSRQVPYSLVVVAKGYRPLGADNFTIGADQEEPVVLTISMSK